MVGSDSMGPSLQLHHIVRACGGDIAVSQVFFSIVDTCLSCEHIARQSCAMVQRWPIFASCILSEPRAAHFRPAF